MSIPALYAAYPAAFLAIVFVTGAVVGSFLNVVIYRLPKVMINAWRQECRNFLAGEQGEQPAATHEDKSFNLAFPASHCPQCDAPIKPWHNIPIISYLALRGACHACKGRISPRYPIIELASALLTLLVVVMLGATPAALWGVVLTWCLIVLTLIDVDHQLLPDGITLPLLWLGILVNAFGVYTDLASSVYGAVAGYLSLWSVYQLFKLVTGKEGMGHGDFKLLAALGAWMGWQMLPLVIILSSFVGAVIGIAGIAVLGRDRNIPIPFGPYLAIAGWLAFLWGDLLTAQYLQFVSVSA